MEVLSVAKLGSALDETLLQNVSYMKEKDDSLLFVTFQSTIGQSLEVGCSQWYIEFNGQECSSPAPIVSLVYKAHSMCGNYRNDYYSGWNIAPAEISGFCNATSSKGIPSGKVDISVFVSKCPEIMTSDAHTGTPRSPLRSTSYLLVEEYCPN